MRKMMQAAMACVLLGASGGLWAADWPGFGGPNGNGAVAGVTAEKLGLTKVWQEQMGNSFGQIAVAGDKAVVFTERGADEYAVCLDARTGKELWTTKIDKSIKDNQGGDGPRSTPAISDGKVYIFSTHLKLVCLDLNTGKESWQHNIAEETEARELHWGSAASPVVVDDLVIVVGGGAGKGILAYQKNGGELAWAKTNEKCTHATPTAATILGTTQVICFMQSGLVSVEAKTGNVLWHFDFPLNNAVGASPVVGGAKGDIVYCSAGYGIGAAACRVSKDGDKWKAAKLWRTEKQNGNHWSTPVYHDGFVYGLVGQNKTAPEERGALVCLDMETGNVKWTQKDIGSQGGLLLLGDKLLVATPTGELVLADASPGGYKELGRQKVLGGKTWTAPSYADGMVYVRSTTDGKAPAEGACFKLGG